MGKSTNLRSTYNRLSFLGLGFILLLVLAESLLFERPGLLVHSEQDSQHKLRVLARQVAHSAALAIKQEQTDNLSALASHLGQEKDINNVRFYSHQGALLAQSEGSQDVLQIYQEAADLMQYVEPIQLEQELLGYLRFSVTRDEARARMAVQSDLRAQQRGLLLMALCCGIMITLGFTRSRWANGH